MYEQKKITWGPNDIYCHLGPISFASCRLPVWAQIRTLEPKKQLVVKIKLT